MKPDHPSRLVLEVGHQQLVFVHVENDRYAAELNGTRCRIRTKRQQSDIDSSGGRRPWEPIQTEGETSNIDTILRCLALDAAHKPLERGIELSATDEWGHFRQKTFLTVVITIAEGGEVNIEEDIREQDESYYEHAQSAERDYGESPLGSGRAAPIIASLRLS